MSKPLDFRSWAARVADQAANERDDREVLRLMSIAVYWERLADLEDWQQHGIQRQNAPAGFLESGRGHAAPPVSR
jgi:hypothetical protein